MTLVQKMMCVCSTIIGQQSQNQVRVEAGCF